MAMFDLARYEVLDVAVMADNSQFASCGEDKAAFLWDVSTGAVVRRMQGHEQRINACCFSTKGSVLFTASYDKVSVHAFSQQVTGWPAVATESPPSNDRERWLYQHQRRLP